MRLFCTKAQQLVDLNPGPVVTIYTCGITPYDSSHLGHAATYLTYDVLQRRLRDLGHETRCVRNVTDVDDDLLRKARELGVHYLDLAASQISVFERDLETLGLLEAYSTPRATSAISEIRGLVGDLLEKGHAYESEGAVYFDISSHADYGEISHLSQQEMLPIAAERGGKPEDEAKKNPLDFVLWQPSAPDEPAWDSLWGPGRPGWHIECSALVRRELGDTIDIHGGGADLIYPHHESEQAQSKCVTGKELARIWMHQAMVRMDGEKMSKSLGNLVFVHHLLEQHTPGAIRLAVAANHYRDEWSWNDDLMPDAARRYDRWQKAGEGDAALDEVRACLDNDLDTVSALAAIDEAAASGHGISQAANLLGIDLNQINPA